VKQPDFARTGNEESTLAGSPAKNDMPLAVQADGIA
jgi:hypothetical protein